MRTLPRPSSLSQSPRDSTKRDKSRTSTPWKPAIVSPKPKIGSLPSTLRRSSSQAKNLPTTPSGPPSSSSSTSSSSGVPRAVSYGKMPKPTGLELVSVLSIPGFDGLDNSFDDISGEMVAHTPSSIPLCLLTSPSAIGVSFLVWLGITCFIFSGPSVPKPASISGLSCLYLFSFPFQTQTQGQRALTPNANSKYPQDPG